MSRKPYNPDDLARITQVRLEVVRQLGIEHGSIEDEQATAQILTLRDSVEHDDELIRLVVALRRRQGFRLVG
jgi:hypothetical protein